QIIESGPAAGVTAVQKLAAMIGLSTVVAFDMGGTTAKASLIEDGEPVDAAGALHVGPTSAGSRPGPACYGHGGELPTLTDANVTLGYLSPRSLAGGTVTIHPDLATKAL